MVVISPTPWSEKALLSFFHGHSGEGKMGTRGAFVVAEQARMCRGVNPVPPSDESTVGLKPFTDELILGTRG